MKRSSLCLLLGFALPLLGQVNTATIYGSVADPTGAAIPGAQAELRNELTATTSAATSNADGQFTFTFVPVGKYTLTVRHPGFTEQVRQGLDLAAGLQLRLNFELQISSSKQTVTVSGGATLLNLASSDQHTTIDNRNVTELPLAKKDWSGLLQLGNGVAKAGSNGDGVSLNGLPPAGFSLTVDGTNAFEDAELPTVGFYGRFNTINTVNSEAIAEVSMSKGIAPASVAGSMSGNINLITKSGTNQFHGSLLEVNSVAAYNARNQFLAKNPGSTFNQFGGSLGGPIIRDKLFFFGNYEGTRLSAFSAISGTVPTSEFVDSTLKVAPEYSSIFSVFPAPNQSYAAGSETAQFIGTGAAVANDNNAVGRFDYYISSNNLVTLRYTRSRPFKLAPNVIAIDPQVTTGHDDTYNAQYTHSTPSWTFVTRAGYNRTNILRINEAYGLGLDGVSFGFSVGAPESFIKRGDITSWEETVAKVIGRHSIQFGGIVQVNDSGRIDHTLNAFSYSTLSDFLANIPSQVQINFQLNPYRLRTYQTGGFFQDDYRVNANLTLNLGVRYDCFSVPKERDGRLFVREATALGPGYGDFRPADAIYRPDWANFAPRLGFAWSVGPDRKTVIRGGSGLFFSPHPIQGAAASAVLNGPNQPFRITLNRAQALTQGLNYPIPDSVMDQLQNSSNPLANTAISDHFPNPYSIQWMLGVERELPGSMVLETNYVGNRALHLNMVRMLNLPDRITGIAPDPSFGSFRYYDGSDASWYDSLQVSLKKRLSNGLTFGFYYTWAHNISYGDGDLWLQANPQDNNNLRADRVPTPYDVRHTVSANFVYEPRFDRWFHASHGTGKLLSEGWQVSGIVTANTGLPVNITESKSSYPSSRPDVLGGVNTIFDDYTSTLQYLNPAAFPAVSIIQASGAAARPGDLGRYAVRAPGQWNLDASLAKSFSIRENCRLQLRADAFDALNHTNLGGLQTDISKSTFGRLTSATPRSLQIGARLVF